MSIIPNEYTDKYLTYNEDLEVISNIIIACDEVLEGNLFISHEPGNKFTINPYFDNKRTNLSMLIQSRKNVCEIGFNAGHSFLLMYNNNNRANYTFFDICRWKYTNLCFDYLKNKYDKDNKLQLINGNSLNSLPDFYNQHNRPVFDFIHIDGGHTPDVFFNDYKYSSLLLEKNGILVIDDTDGPWIEQLIRSDEFNNNYMPMPILENRCRYTNKINQLAFIRV